MGFLDDAINSLGSGLAQSAVQFASDETGFNVGGILSTLFQNGDDSTTGGSIVSEMTTLLQGLTSGPSAATLQANFKQITDGIDSLGVQLTAVASEIAQISGTIANIEELVKEIQQEQLYSTWQAVNQTLQDPLANLTADYGSYSHLISKYSKTKSSRIHDFLAAFLNAPEGSPSATIQLINQLIIPSGQQKGLLQLWSEMVASVVSQGLLDYREAVRQYTAYYSQLAYAQLQATNLMMEASAYIDDTSSAADQWTAYRKVLLTQENSFIESLVPLIAAGIQASSDGYIAVLNWSYYEGSTQLHAGIQCLPSDNPRDSGYYSPSAVFTAAERLLANLYVTQPTDRRIVVHLLYPDYDGTINRAIQAQNIQIQPAGGTQGQKIVATSDSTFGPYTNFLGSPTGQWNPADPNFLPCSFYVRRLVFSDADPANLADGAYTLVDLNGTLPPMWTYAGGGSTPFQETKVLAHELSVSAAGPFDFMNFSGYMVSTDGPIPKTQLHTKHPRAR